MATAGFAVHCLYRPLVLMCCRSTTFNIVNVLPYCFLLLAVLVTPSASAGPLGVAFGAAFLLGGAATLVPLGFDWWPKPFTWLALADLRSLGSYSFYSGIIPLMNYGTVVGTYELVRVGAEGDWMAGMFSVPLLLISTATLPFTMLSPLLFKRWAEDHGTRSTSSNIIDSLHVAALFAFGATPLLLTGVWVGIPLVFGERFRPAVAPALLLAAGAYFFVQAKVLGTTLMAINEPRKHAILTALRSALILAMLFSGFRKNLFAIALAWFAGDGLFTLGAAWLSTRKLGKPLVSVLGLDPGHWRTLVSKALNGSQFMAAAYWTRAWSRNS
jgi:O-antigen/teichoic acid export membrane protein